ncbi:MAG: inositol monophosphatase, partial [Rhodospirillaceae bacterium]
GIGRFAMMIALVRGGETVMGWIHDPLAGTTLLAERGAGAWHLGPYTATAPRRIPQNAQDLSAMTVALHHRVFGPHLGLFGRNLRLGSAAHDYWALAEGRVQIVSYRRLKPWDHAAGVLIHEEAGGYARLLSGEPYRPAASNQEGLLCTPSASVWENIAALTRAS